MGPCHFVMEWTEFCWRDFKRNKGVHKWMRVQNEKKNNDYYYSDVIMSAMASKITGVTLVCSTICSGADQKNIKAPHHWPLWAMDSPHKWPVTRKMFLFDDVIMLTQYFDMINSIQIFFGDCNCKIIFAVLFRNGTLAHSHSKVLYSLWN